MLHGHERHDDDGDGTAVAPAYAGRLWTRADPEEPDARRRGARPRPCTG